MPNTALSTGNVQCCVIHFRIKTHVMPPTTRSQLNTLGVATYAVYQQWLWRRLRMWVRLIKRAQRRLAELLRQEAFDYAFYGDFF